MRFQSSGLPAKASLYLSKALYAAALCNNVFAEMVALSNSALSREGASVPVKNRLAAAHT